MYILRKTNLCEVGNICILKLKLVISYLKIKRFMLHISKIQSANTMSVQYENTI